MITGTLCEKVNQLIALITGWICVDKCVVVGFVTVSQDGEIAAVHGDNITVTRIGVGHYEITSPPGAQIAHSQVVNPFGSRDDIKSAFSNSFTQGQFWIGEGDNAGNPDTLRDYPFSVVWYGIEKRVTCSS